MRLALPAASIEFAVEGSTHGRWDASRIKQILSNLVANAAKYGDSNGTIRVTLRGNDAEVRLSVENSGSSISKRDLELLFEPLRRGTEHEAPGEHTSLGLGLFIVRQVALAHGGQVTAESAGRRTEFTVILPKNRTGGVP